MSNNSCSGFTTRSPQVGFDKDRACGDIAEVSSCLGKEVIDLTVDIWDDPGCDGDNVVRIFNKDECVYHDGYFYWSLEDMNVDMPPTTKWSGGSTKCEILKPSLALTNCGGEPLVSGESVPTCLELSERLVILKEEVLDEIPKLEKCGGGDVDGPVIQCDQLDPDDFIVENGVVKVNTPDAACVDVTTAPADPCAGLQRSYLAVTGDCGIVVGSSNIDIRVGQFLGTTLTAPVKLPASTTDMGSIYTIADLQADANAGTIDFTRLDVSGAANCQMIDFPCDDFYTFTVEATLPVDYGNAGIGNFIVFIDDLPAATSSGNLATQGLFTSVNGSYQKEKNLYVTAGSHKVCVYQLSGNTGVAAQVQYNTSTSPYIIIDRLVEE